MAVRVLARCNFRGLPQQRQVNTIDGRDQGDTRVECERRELRACICITQGWRVDVVHYEVERGRVRVRVAEEVVYPLRFPIGAACSHSHSRPRPRRVGQSVHLLDRPQDVLHPQRGNVPANHHYVTPRCAFRLWKRVNACTF